MKTEDFVATVADLAIAQLICPDEKAKTADIKLTYGSGPDGTRGVTYFRRWKKGVKVEAVPFVAISAIHQESVVQLAGTTIHELGHVLAGFEAAHGPAWKKSCERLGLRRILAAGTNYTWAHFKPELRQAIVALGSPTDGTPVSLMAAPGGAPIKLKPCGSARGARGGKSFGVGSGSRLRLYECEGIGHKAFKVRIATDAFEATCDCCNTKFLRR